jgi:diguanylate cyclase (GGDEF)-like protein
MTDIDTLVNSLATAAGRLLGQHAVALLLVDRDGSVVARGDEHIAGRLDHGSIQQLMTATHDHDRVLRVPDTIDCSPALVEAAHRIGARSLLLVPLRPGGMPHGALLISRSVPQAFTRREIESAMVLADLAASHLTSILLLDAERAERRRTQALLEVAQAVTQSADLETALTGIARAAAGLSVARRCAIFLLDEAGRPRPGGGWDLEQAVVPERAARVRAFPDQLERQGLLATMAEVASVIRGPVHIFERMDDMPAFIRRWAEEFGFHSIALYPLVARRGAVGLISLTANNQAVRFPPDEIEAMRAIALQAAAVIEHLNLLGEVKEQALRDGLTGLYNHRYLKESLDREIAEMHRSGRPLAVVLLDIDGMKGFNDSRGHVAGDAVLQWVAESLKATFRESDIIARYGGDEFSVLMPNTSAGTALELSRRLLTRISAAEPGAAASVGIALAPDDALSATALFEVADAAMYAAKRRGPGGVVLAGGSPQGEDAARLRLQ